MGVLGVVLPPGLFTFPFMQHAYVAGAAVAIMASAVGTFVVLRGQAFAAHAIPRLSFTGALGAALLGTASPVALAAFSVLGAGGIALLGRRGRSGPGTALVLTAALGLGALFLAVGGLYPGEGYAILFGQVLGVSQAMAGESVLLLVVTLVVLALIFRPLLLVSVVPEVALAKGRVPFAMDLLFLLLLGVASAVAVPIVGALLAFSLTVGPAAAACRLARSVSGALALAALFALGCMEFGLILTYDTGWPAGFFVAGLGMLTYLLGRLGGSGRRPRVKG